MIIIKTIGILGKTLDNNIVYVKNIIDRFNGVNIVGIFSNSDYSICDGFIIQGGKNIENWYYDVIEYAINNKKALLGICLGCQALGTYRGGSLINCSNHLNTSHEIIIEKNSILYSIFGNRIITNSRHRQCIKKISPYFFVTARSMDGVIEAIEYKDNSLFIVGVQFHPEDLDNMGILFDKFVSHL